MDRKYEDVYLLEYNEICARILCRERKKRKISREKLACGLLSRTALEKMERGAAGWTKVTGDILMHRMGIPTDYFEETASAEELDRWRMREDICLLVPREPGAAREKLRGYRRRYRKREPVEEQFLLKAEALLLLEQIERKRSGEGQGPADAQRFLETARRAVSCTIPGGGEGALEDLWLAPAELEALLLEAAALGQCGREAQASALWQYVWDYPRMRGWNDCMRLRIVPQTALAGMRAAMGERDGRRAFDLGREALELLRRHFSHCYVIPLLEGLCAIPADSIAGCGDGERRYLCQAERFRDAFRKAYREFDYPGHRIWQGIAVDNTREIGVTLRMLRRFEGKSQGKAVFEKEPQEKAVFGRETREKAIADGAGDEPIMTKRQLEKIEKGVHKPSYANYRRLIRQYHKPWAWKTALLETDSVEILELRREISNLLGFAWWEEAERKMELFCGKVNGDAPRVRQELLFWGVNRKAIQNGLKCSEMICMASAFYRLAWNLYEAAQEGEREALRPKWKNAFRISVVLSEFTYDAELEAFLSEEARRKKFEG